MVANVRIGSAHVTVSANTAAYQRGMANLVQQNQRAVRSFNAYGRELRRNAVFIDQFNNSLRSSLVATAAYAVGVGAVGAGLRGVTSGFLDFDQGLIRIQKTTDLTGDSVQRLGERLVRINTEGIGEGRAFGVLREDLLDIAEAAGQAGISTARGIAQITRAAAALQVSSDLIGRDAVRALTRYLQVTGQSVERVNAIASAYTNLGNNIVGTESEISQ